MRTHYTYRITNLENNMHYYGVRTTPDGVAPKDDLGKRYFSSSTIVKPLARNNKESFKFKVVATFKSRSRAMLHETNIHLKFDVASHEKFYNKCNAWGDSFISRKGTNKGTVTAYDKILNKNVKIDITTYAENQHRYKTPRVKKVHQFDIEGNYIKSYDSVAQAIKIFNNTGIYRCCLGTSKQCGGYRWSYEKKLDKLKINAKTPKKVYAYSENGLIRTFINIQEVINFYGIVRPFIYKKDWGRFYKRKRVDGVLVGRIKDVPRKDIIIFSAKELNVNEVKKRIEYNSQKQSGKTMKKKKLGTRKKIYQYDLEFNLIKEFELLCDVYKDGWSSTVGLRCSKEDLKPVQGYIWSDKKLK